MIGAGWWAGEHAAALSTLEGFQVTAVSSGTLGSAQALAGQYGAQAYATSEALLDSHKVDAVLVAAPHEFHRALALQVIERRLPLLLEKPVAITREQTHDILNAAQAAQVPCLVGFTSHYFPGFAQARALLQGGDLGAVISGQSVFQKVWLEPNRQEWHFRREQGGGMLLTAGIHALDRLMWLMDSPVQAVSAVIGTRWHDQPADDAGSLFLRMQNRAGFVGSYGYRRGGPENSVTLQCEGGTLRATPNSLEVGQNDRWGKVPLKVGPRLVRDALAQEWLDLREWKHSGRTPQVPPDFARHVMDVLFAAEQSSDEGAEVRL